MRRIILLAGILLSLFVLANRAQRGDFPAFSPDGQHLFIVSDRISQEARKGPESPLNGSSDIYWVDASFIEDLRKEALKDDK